MPRPLRWLVPNAIYHVTVRGNNRQSLFRDAVDCEAYLAIAASCLRAQHAELLAYALMSNHVHLVLCDREARLSELMRRLNVGYTHHFNRRHGRVGQLYQGRFLSRLVTTDAYALEVTRYVHLNPVRAQLVRTPAAYQWSSYRAYLGAALAHQTVAATGLVTTALVLQMVDSDLSRSVKRYCRFVESMTMKALPRWERRLRRLRLIGSFRFAHEMQRTGVPGTCDERLTNTAWVNRMRP